MLETLSAPTGSETSLEEVNLAFSRLRPLIMESTQICDAYARRMQSIFATLDKVLCMRQYTWKKIQRLTIQTYPKNPGWEYSCQNFLVFGHCQGRAFLECWALVGGNRLIQSGQFTAYWEQTDQFFIEGVPGDQITFLSPQQFDFILDEES